MTTYTDTQAVQILTAEGHAEADVIAAFDSMIGAGLTLDQPDDGRIITGEELDVLRDQLAS